NVLTPVLMAAEALRSEVESKEADDLISTITDAGKRGALLVKQVLTFARGRRKEMLPVPLRHVVNEVRRLLAESLPESIRLKIVNVSRDVTVIGNSTELIQVVMNLCVNARDAMPAGGTIEVRCDETTDEEGRRWARLTVIDTGAGIPPEVMEKVGKAFFSTKPEGAGKGLGLATVKMILDHHDGHLKILSESGQGSTFEAWFPATDASVDSGETKVHFVRVHGQGELILICDDDAAIREIAAGAIACHGFEVICAGDGAEATALYAQHQERIAAVITDLKMPYLDGLGVIRCIRRLGGKMPVVLMTTEREELPAADLEELCAALLPKPFTTTNLLTAVANAVKNVQP
ncbi:MAG: hybrid sensor histidine kinase/response regulator, partial [Limisphaerales bacterium]